MAVLVAEVLLMVKALKIGAVICLALAAFMLIPLLADTLFTRGGGVITRKYTERSGPITQFRLDCRLNRGGGYDCPYSQGFYEVAKAGDQLEFPLTGITLLVHDGHVIKYNFSEEFVFPTMFAFVALLPSIVFVRGGRLPYERVIYILLGLIEVLIIGGMLAGTFLACC